MEKPKMHEMLSAAREVSEIGMEAARLCVADLITWIGSKIDDAQDVWGQEVDEEVESE